MLEYPQLFHKRNRKLVLLGALGGVYLPCLERIIPYKVIRTFLKGYSAILVSCLLFCTLMAVRHMIFLADNLIVRIMAANNVFNDLLCSGRALYFNIHRDRAQRLFDMWDEFFTGDAHEDHRKKILSEIRGPFKKFVYGSGGMIQFMLLSWSLEQFGHENCEFSVPTGLPFHNENPEYLIFATLVFFTFSLFGPMLLSVDAMIQEPLSLLAGEFIRLRESLVEIVGAIKVKEDGSIVRFRDNCERAFVSKKELDDDVADTRKRLKGWITEHQNLLKFHDATVEMIYWPLALQLVCTTLTICMISFIIATNLLNPFDAFIGLLFFVPNYILFFITSRYGDLVRESAERVFDDAYASSWAIYPKDIKYMLFIIAMKTNYPVRINIIEMFVLGSNTYFSIVQTGYSFYSFLRVLTSK